MRMVSLFAGIGGFDLGAQRAGIETVALVEKDPHCRKLLADKFSPTLIFEDVVQCGSSNLPPCDIVCGGFPCQDLSVAGERAGLQGSRSGLFYEQARITRELGARFFVGENVPGLFSSDEGRDFARILGELGHLGARDIAWATLDAQWFGVAQRRRRVFIVADFAGESASEILSLSEGLRGDPPPRRKKGERITPTITGRTRKRGGQYAGGTDFDIDGGLIPDVAWALQERDGKGPDSDTKEGHLIPAKSSVRRLTPLECERLQGFPDNWTDGFSDSTRYRMLGNAVAVPVTNWLFRQLIKHA